MKPKRERSTNKLGGSIRALKHAVYKNRVSFIRYIVIVYIVVCVISFCWMLIE